MIFDQKVASQIGNRVFSVFVPRAFFDRALGLIGQKTLGSSQGLWLTDCWSIHMWGMSIPLDVVFLKKTMDGAYVIVSIHKEIRPWALFPLSDFSATDTLELSSQASDGLQVGDHLCFV